MQKRSPTAFLKGLIKGSGPSTPSTSALQDPSDSTPKLTKKKSFADRLRLTSGRKTSTAKVKSVSASGGEGKADPVSTSASGLEVEAQKSSGKGKGKARAEDPVDEDTKSPPNPGSSPFSPVGSDDELWNDSARKADMLQERGDKRGVAGPSNSRPSEGNAAKKSPTTVAEQGMYGRDRIDLESEHY